MLTRLAEIQDKLRPCEREIVLDAANQYGNGKISPETFASLVNVFNANYRSLKHTYHWTLLHEPVEERGDPRLNSSAGGNQSCNCGGSAQHEPGDVNSQDRADSQVRREASGESRRSTVETWDTDQMKARGSSMVERSYHQDASCKPGHNAKLVEVNQSVSNLVSDSRLDDK